MKDCVIGEGARTHELNGEKIRCYKCGEFGHEQAHCTKHMLTDKTYVTVKRPKNVEIPKEMAVKRGEDDPPEVLRVKDDWKKDVECFRCHKKGHFANDCTEPDRRGDRKLPNAPTPFPG